MGEGLPDPILWLAAAEVDLLSGLRVPKRRNDWLLGRWTAKQAVSAWLGRDPSLSTLADISILPAEDRAPEAYSQGRRLPVAISLSHRHGRGLSSIVSAGSAVGCDLELIEPRTAAFVRDCFTDQERDWLKAQPDRRHDLLVNLIWSAKESGLKLLRTGLSADTRSIEADPRADGKGPWRRLQIRPRGDVDPIRGWWREEAGFVMTFVASPSPGIPRRLTQPESG